MPYHYRFVQFIVAVISCLSRLAYGAQLEVVVGGPSGLQFSPSTVTASSGDTVLFVFKQSNHSATESSFEHPCVAKSGGFDSGFMPVTGDEVTFPATVHNVTGEDPVWFYCRQANHCQQGMVFAINPGDKFSMFQAAAMSSAPSSSSMVLSNSAVLSSSKAASATSSAVPGPTATSSDHMVVVGGPNNLLFSPSNISAHIGDTVTFQFHQKNHTVTQSTFAQPCVGLMESSTSGQVGFDSGFMPVADNATSFPTYTIQINDTSPIWAFCRQTNHCGAGMVFSVNAPASGPSTYEAFAARAKQLNGTMSGLNSVSSASTPFLTISNWNARIGFSACVATVMLMSLL